MNAYGQESYFVQFRNACVYKGFRQRALLKNFIEILISQMCYKSCLSKVAGCHLDDDPCKESAMVYETFIIERSQQSQADFVSAYLTVESSTVPVRETGNPSVPAFRVRKDALECLFDIHSRSRGARQSNVSKLFLDIACHHHRPIYAVLGWIIGRFVSQASLLSFIIYITQLRDTASGLTVSLAPNTRRNQTARGMATLLV